jgi:hypothetical protein
MSTSEQTPTRQTGDEGKPIVGRSRAREAIALIDRWLSDESDYDEKTWPELKAALDRDRLSDRKLFDD